MVWKEQRLELKLPVYYNRNEALNWAVRKKWLRETVGNTHMPKSVI